MLLEEEFVNVRVNGRTYKYYEDLGYEIPKKYNKKNELKIDNMAYFKVKVKDLLKQSNIIVAVICDYCGTKFEVKYDNRFKNIDKSIIKKDACKSCVSLKLEESNIKIYGVKSVMNIEEIKDKIKNTCIEKYGVDSPFKIDGVREKIDKKILEKFGVKHQMQSIDIKNKTKNTCIERYGVDNPMKNEDIKQKLSNSNIKKYGVKNPSMLDEIKNKIQESNLSKYGKRYTLQVPEFRRKAFITMHKNGTQKCSKQQKYIHDIIGGELNYPVDRCSLDIAFPDEKIYVEYDGGGHDLNVKLGSMTQEKFNEKEIKRYMFLKSRGWKQIRIISPKDYILKEKDLITLIKDCKNKLKNRNKNHINIELDNKNCEYELIKL